MQSILLDTLRAFNLLSRLSACLWSRFQQTGDRRDLDWSIALARLLVDSCSPDFPGLWGLVNNLAVGRVTRYERWRCGEDLDRAIVLRRDAIALCPRDHGARNDLMKILGTSLWTRFGLRGGRINGLDVDELIEIHRAALALLPNDHPDRPASLGHLATFLLVRSKRTWNADDLCESISLFHEALPCFPEGHPYRAGILDGLANSLHTQFERTGCVDDLNEAIQLYRDALFLETEGRLDRPSSLDNLANSLNTRFKLKGDADDLKEAIRMHRDALSLRPEGHRDRLSSLNNLAIALQTRFKLNGDKDDLEETVGLLRASLNLCPDGHPDRSLSLNNLAVSLKTLFEQERNLANLSEAIELHRAALALRPEGHPNRPISLSNLANALKTRFEQSRNVDDLNEVVQLYRVVLALRPQGHADRPSSLTNLASALHARFNHSRNIDDLNEIVQLYRVILTLQPEDDPDRPSSLHRLASSLQSRFERSGIVKDLNEAVQLFCVALSLLPDAQADSASSLSDLATSLRTRFQRSGNADDSNEAAQLHRVAHSPLHEGYSDRTPYLCDLAYSLQTRSEYSGVAEDLDEALQLYRDALALSPEDHPDRFMIINRLANCLRTRFERDNVTGHLDEAVRLHRVALTLLPLGDPTRFLSLNNLAGTLQIRFKSSGNEDDLNESVSLHREALALCPDGHPYRPSPLNNLAISLHSRFDHCGCISDLDESITLYCSSLSRQPYGHPVRSGTMFNLANACHARFLELGRRKDFRKCIQLLRRAADHTFSPILMRLKASYRWAKLAQDHDHSSTLVAYRNSISLLQRALAVQPDLTGRHEMLIRGQVYQNLGMDAAAYAIEKGNLTVAIELLEQGRALLWSQMRGLRTPLDRLKEANKPLAERFGHVSNQLEALMTSSERRSASSVLDRGSNGSYDRRRDDERIEHVRRLSEEQEALVSDIRKIPGFEGFLHSVRFETLRQVAIEGPVVIVNHSQVRCDALILLPRDVEPCVYVPLDEKWFPDALDLYNDLLQARSRHGVQSSEYDETLRRVMNVLWDRVVSKVVQKLDELGIAKGSRIWWCPTLFLSAFPFHAAGPYVDENGATKYLLDDYISSYMPTLTSLIAARSGIRIGSERLLFVGDTKLGAMEELANIRTHRRVAKRLLDEAASRDSVTNALRKVEWVHFACHGELNPENPFNSSFALPGGKLTLLDIARANLPNAEFAFLSACHTAEQRPALSLDESLHLAAAIQFCGFRSVVGTMWELLDEDGPILSDAVYSHLMNMVEEEGIRFKGAAAAVREAALHLKRSQRVEIMAERWVNLIHIGA